MCSTNMSTVMTSINLNNTNTAVNKWLNRKLRAQRSFKRDDTLARHQDFVIPATVHFGTAIPGFTVTKHMLTLPQKDVADEHGITRRHLSSHWGRHARALYGENRYWPGPESEFQLAMRGRRLRYVRHHMFKEGKRPQAMTREEIIEANRAMHHFIPKRPKRTQSVELLDELEAAAALADLIPNHCAPEDDTSESTIEYGTVQP